MPNLATLDPQVDEGVEFNVPEPAIAAKEHDVSPVPRTGIGKVYLLSMLAGMVGALLTFMILWFPIKQGDFTATVALIPFLLFLIALANAWMATFIFFLGADSES